MPSLGVPAPSPVDVRRICHQHSCLLTPAVMVVACWQLQMICLQQARCERQSRSEQLEGRRLGTAQVWAEDGSMGVYPAC